LHSTLLLTTLFEEYTHTTNDFDDDFDDDDFDDDENDDVSSSCFRRTRRTKKQRMYDGVVKVVYVYVEMLFSFPKRNG
tara:strand:- start:426 stop:659 length:234 start_codon:yes stop_codon:yes gene_type:complete